MSKKILLSIAVTTAITCNPAAFAATDDVKPHTHVDPKAKTAGCAAGKCGGLKKFEEVDTTADPQDKLVHARDGKCGVSGHSTQPVKPGKCASGVCGNTE